MYPLEDPTPLGELQDDSSYFIHINSLNQNTPAFVQFEIKGNEAPQKVERNFGDLSTGKGTKVQHLYREEGHFTIIAKLNTKKGQIFLLKTEIKIGESSDTAYNLNINPLFIESKRQSASFQPDFQ